MQSWHAVTTKDTPVLMTSTIHTLILTTKPKQLQKNRHVKWHIYIFPVNCAYKKENPSYTDFSLDMDQELYWVLSHLCSYPEPGALVWALTEPGSMMRRGGGGEEWGGESNFPFLITSQKKEMPVREAAVLSQIHTKRLRPGREARGPSRAG